MCIPVYIYIYIHIYIYIYTYTYTYVHIHTNQMLYALCAQAETPRDLAILMLRNQESKAAFCACCDAVCESVICTHATANFKKAMADTRKPHAGKQLNNVCVCVYILICVCMYVYLWRKCTDIYTHIYVHEEHGILLPYIRWLKYHVLRTSDGWNIMFYVHQVVEIWCFHTWDNMWCIAAICFHTLAKQIITHSCLVEK